MHFGITLRQHLHCVYTAVTHIKIVHSFIGMGLKDTVQWLVAVFTKYLLLLINNQLNFSFFRAIILVCHYSFVYSRVFQLRGGNS
jgi:hypothetical protein